MAARSEMILTSFARGFLKDESEKEFIKIDPVWGFAEFPPPGDAKKHTLPILIDPEEVSAASIAPVEKNADAKKDSSSQLK